MPLVKKRKSKARGGFVLKKAAAAEKLNRRVKAARKDFKSFLLNVWANEPGFELANFHDEAIEAYTNFTTKFTKTSITRFKTYA